MLENSPKIVILAELVDRSVHLGDKILIFRFVFVVSILLYEFGYFSIHIIMYFCSQSLNTLSYIEKLLSQRQIPMSNSTNPTGPIQYSNLRWTKNKNYCSKQSIKYKTFLAFDVWISMHGML